MDQRPHPKRAPSLQSTPTASTKVQRALHWFQYISKGGAPLLLSSISSLFLIFGGLGPNLSTLLLLLSVIYALYLYSAPIIRHPQAEPSEVIKLTLPLMWVTSLWVVAASFTDTIDAITPISALMFGVLLSLVPRYLIPILFLVTVCFELSLIVQYPISLGSGVFHIVAHLLSALTIPRKVTPTWVVRSFYPRLLDIEELPLKNRFFDPSKFRSSHEHITNVRIGDQNFRQGDPNLTSDGLEWDSSPLGSHTAVSGRSITPAPSKDVTLNTDAVEESLPPPLESKIQNETQYGNITRLIRSYSPIQGEREIERAVKAHNQRAIAFINRSMKVNLELLRQQLHVETAVLLWLRPSHGQLEVRAVDTIRDEWTATRFDRHYGILEEALAEPLEFNDPIEAHYLVPYYDESLTIGGLLSYPITLNEGESADGVLLVDRGSNEPWDQGDRSTLRIIAEKIALDIETSRLIRQVAFDGGQVERLCYSLRQLNEAFSADDVAQCAVKGVGSYEGYLSASYFSVDVGVGIRLVSRWLSSKGLGLDPSKPVLEKGAFLAWSDAPIFHALEEQYELSTLTHPLPPSAYLPCYDDVLANASAALVVPMFDPQNHSVLGLVILSAVSEDLVQSKNLAAIRILFEQVVMKLSSITAHERLRQMALRDGLTGLKNHMTFQSESTEMLKRAERDKSPITFALIDIDHFKSVNDTYGHPFGDVVLKRVASTLDQEVRDIDLVSRYGGEEFALALHATDLEQAQVTLERVRRSVERLSFEHQGEAVHVTISIGIACYPIDSRDKERLVERADKALYQSKRNGRNQATAWREIAPEQRDSSVGWTRHPEALVPQFSPEELQSGVHVLDNDQAISAVLIPPVHLDYKGGQLPFELEAMIPEPLFGQEIEDNEGQETHHDLVINKSNTP